jgi:hypothetical protein
MNRIQSPVARAIPSSRDDMPHGDASFSTTITSSAPSAERTARSRSPGLSPAVGMTTESLTR